MIGRRRRALILVAVMVVIGIAAASTIFFLQRGMTSMRDRGAGFISSVHVVGDSLTLGVGASSAGSGYVDRLVGSLSQETGAEVRLNRLAQGGATTGQFLASQGGRISEGASLAIIELGTNDIDRTNVADFASAYSSVLGRVAPANDVQRLVCLGVWGDPRRSAPYDEVISESCTGSGGEFVPISDLYIANGLRGNVDDPLATSDNFHPNDSGHASIARRVLVALNGSE